jgi:asparagine synthase (glutamine-hydrolysing)
MCGIVGKFVNDGLVDRPCFKGSTETLRHRGPDDGDCYFSGDGKLAFGHRRLSFIDLTEAGRQPFSAHDGSVVVTLNGEIYNYVEVRNRLKDAYPFRTDTDTEVLVAAYLKWGIDCLKHLRGMFAFGLYDCRSQKVYLVRDRFGIKPLYYTSDESGFSFASELKALLELSPIKKEVDFSAMADFFVYRYVPSPKTIWKGVSKLPPAHYLEFSLEDGRGSLTEYWKIPGGSAKRDSSDLVSSVNGLLESSVREHLRADVPIGAFLSGGYDSSALAHYMKEAGAPPHTFSVGFDGWRESEHNFAKTVSGHLGLENDSVILNESSLRLVDRMPRVYDEPIADISIIPTYAVSRLARRSVKAVFSGEGADELFGGYTWQHGFHERGHPTRWFDRVRQMAQPLDIISHYASSMAMGLFDRDELRKMFEPEFHQYIADDIHWFYRKHLRNDFRNVKAIQYLDVKTFMAELVLTKVDRASMANSVEVRVPFLDHRLFEEIFTTHESCYLRPGQTKYLLYQCIRQYLPKTILERKKQGFVGPDSYYMDNNWYRKELTNSTLVRDGIIRRSYMDALLQESYTWKLWKMLIMEKWYKTWSE